MCYPCFMYVKLRNFIEQGTNSQGFNRDTGPLMIDLRETNFPDYDIRNNSIASEQGIDYRDFGVSVLDPT